MTKLSDRRGNAWSAATVADKLPKPSDAPAGRRFAAAPWLGRVRNLIHSPQEDIRVTEIREDTNSTLLRQSSRSTSRANTNERKANTATCTSIPNSVTNIDGAGK